MGKPESLLAIKDARILGRQATPYSGCLCIQNQDTPTNIQIDIQTGQAFNIDVKTFIACKLSPTVLTLWMVRYASNIQIHKKFRVVFDHLK